MEAQRYPYTGGRSEKGLARTVSYHIIRKGGEAYVGSA